MTAMQPMAMYGLQVPAGDVAVPALIDFPAAFRITMAAIDPSAEPQGDEGDIPRATLKVIRAPLMDDDEDDDEFDQDEMERMLAEDDSEDSDDDEEVNGGPSDPLRSKKAKREAAAALIKEKLAEDGMDVDDLPNGTSKSEKAIGKLPASDEEDDDDDDSDEDDMDSDEGEIEEFVICTLDPSKTYQQYLDITFGEDEQVWFKVSGTHNIYLTGNYVEATDSRGGMFDPDSDDELDYDLEPDEDELEDDEDESIDELDELEDPRIEELEDDDEAEAPALIKANGKKAAKVVPASKKRPAPESADEDEVEGGAEGLDELISKEAAKAAQSTLNGEQKLSKKQLKKLKKNNGTAGDAPTVESLKKEDAAEAPSSAKSDKKVQFAKELEQGPTPTKKEAAADKTTGDKAKPSLGVKTVQGVTMDDKKLGSGQAAKNGDRVGMRYIGKLKDNNKVFDSNKKGKPFSFKLGSGEVIKGWDIGVQGMQVGGERRITIPAHLAYGSKRMGNDIPPNSALVFDVKVLDINKGK